MSTPWEIVAEKTAFDCGSARASNPIKATLAEPVAGLEDPVKGREHPVSITAPENPPGT